MKTSAKPVNVLLLGSGGRESALADKISQSPLLGTLFIAPGNAGTGAYGINLPFAATDFAAVSNAVEEHAIDLVVVGPEDPLVRGLREHLEKHTAAGGRPVLMVGPGAAGAALEGSKDFAKRFMERHGIPTARHLTVDAATVDDGLRFLKSLKAPYVLKADGLAAGKGVLIIDSLEEAGISLRQMLAGSFGAASAKVVIEEFLSGIECSVFVLTDGAGNYRILPPAKDYKRIGEGDTGLNTGGMGAVCPPPFADDDFMAKVEARIVRPTVDGLIAEGIDYRGFIFLGLIKVAGGDPMVIEYNARMGDPETEAVMPRITSDILPLLIGVAQGNIGDAPLEVDARPAVTVMAVSGGYPGDYAKGKRIGGCLAPEGSVVYHAGTKADASGTPLTAGGRVLAVTSLAPTIAEAAAASYAALEGIEFEGMYYRRDIARDILAML